MNIDFDNLARLIKLTETAQIHSLEIQDGTQTIKLTKYPSDTPPAPVGHIARHSPHQSHSNTRQSKCQTHHHIAHAGDILSQIRPR